MGEAAGRVQADVTEANAQIPWSRMRAMRNVVVHEDFGIDEEVLWGTIAEDLKPLLLLFAALLAATDD
ncbi:MAG TPA: HepT-like ribonuclease domain-containing protein [Thermoleophilia bacterium]|nr:HepT-like ribonuclease domain-containing protein [Thermoleophilia bacterium]